MLGSKGCKGGKSGLHGNTVPGNTRRGRPQGKCHRNKPLTDSSAARVKRCGKSAPHSRQRLWPGKPHREQDRIGVVWAQAQGCFRLTARVGRAKHSAMNAPDEWPSMAGNRRDRTRLTGRLTFLLRDGADLKLFVNVPGGNVGQTLTTCSP